MHDDFLSERCRNDVVVSAKGGERTLVGQAADRIEPQLFSDQRDAAAQDNPAWREQRDRLSQGERDGTSSSVEDGRGFSVSLTRRLGNKRRGDRIRISPRLGQERPVGSALRQLSTAELPSGRRDRPSRRDLLQFDGASAVIRTVRHAQVPDLDRTMAGPAVDLLIDDECAADSAADIHIKEGRMTDACTEASFRQPGGIRVVLEDDQGYLKMVANPRRQRKIVPTVDLERLLRASAFCVNRPAEANAGGAQTCRG